jgi:hypothetical protein
MRFWFALRERVERTQQPRLRVADPFDDVVVVVAHLGTQLFDVGLRGGAVCVFQITLLSDHIESGPAAPATPAVVSSMRASTEIVLHLGAVSIPVHFLFESSHIALDSPSIGWIADDAATS